MTGFLRPGLLLLALPLLGVSHAQAQVIQGRLIDEGTGQPVEGALVRLFDAAGNVRDGYLTNSSGRFRLNAPGPGSYSAVADRIGYRSADSGPLSVAEGDVIDIELRTAFAPIPLDAIRVEGEKNCVVRPEEGEVLTRLWHEAQKVLVAQNFTADDDTYPFSILRYTRTLDERGMRIESEEQQRRTVVAPTAIRSRGADDLLTNGFVQLKDGEEPVYEYFGPDADVLLSEGFLDSHCLRLGDVDEEAGLVGVGFEPVRRGGPPDIEGTFWLALEDARLTALEFRYTWAPAFEAEGHARGRIGFEELPNGGWIIRDWWIRTPILTTHFASNQGIRHRIVGFSEEGEEISRLDVEEYAGVEHPRGAIRGLVWDRGRGAPLTDATVYLSGTQHSDVTASDGSFAFDGIREGRYTLAFLHPGLDTLGVSVPGSEVEVVDGETAGISLAVPPIPTLLRTLCPGEDEESAFLTGTVTDAATGRTRSSAGVSLVWTDFDVPGGREIRGTRQSREVTTDSQGRYRACGITSGAEVTVRASIGACTGPTLQTVVPGGQINQMHLAVNPDACGPNDAPVLVCPSGGIHPEMGAVEGKVVDAATNVPVGHVEVWIVALAEATSGTEDPLASEPLVVRADAAGRFQVCPLVPGRYRVLVESQALGKAEVEVEIPAGELAYLTLGLEGQPGSSATSGPRPP